MKVLIPFNSKDFNNIFSTLSISPRALYPMRNFGFTRCNPTFLNPLENVLLGYSHMPRLTNHTDMLDGYPILIETEVDPMYIQKTEKMPSFDLYYLSDTVYIIKNEFKLIFRTEKELNEVFTRSERSIETKFVQIARESAEVLNDSYDYFETEGEKVLDLPTFKNENIEYDKRINKDLGAITGDIVASLTMLPDKWREIQIKNAEFLNEKSFYLNSIAIDGNQASSRENVNKLIDQIAELIEAELPLLDTMSKKYPVLDKTFIDEVLRRSIGEIPVLDILKVGIRRIPKIGNRPVHLLLDDLKEAINSELDTKHFDTYQKGIINAYAEFDDELEVMLKSVSQNADINSRIKLHNGNLIHCRYSLSEFDKKAYEITLEYFLSRLDLNDPEQLQMNREDHVDELGKIMKGKIPEFDKSEQRQYLYGIRKSFKNLKAGFDVNSINSDVFKSLGILFTRGTDITKFMDNINKSRIIDHSIPMSIWGAVIGLAKLPKTLTEQLFTDGVPSESIYFQALKNYFNDDLDEKKAEEDALGEKESYNSGDEVKFPYNNAEERYEDPEDKNNRDIANLLKALEHEKGWKGTEAFVKWIKQCYIIFVSNPKLELEGFQDIKNFLEILTGKGAPEKFGSKKAEMVVHAYQKIQSKE